MLKSPLSGSITIDNNLNYATLSKATTKGFVETVATDPGPVNGSVEISYTNGDFRKVQVNGPITSLTMTNWPIPGYAKMRVWLVITSTSQTITFSGTYIGLNKIPGVTSNTLTPMVGNYLIEFSTIDGGTTILVNPLITP